MAARISRTIYPFWQTAPKIRLMTTSRLLAGGISRLPFLLCLPSADRPAAVDDEFGTGDVAALLAGEPQDAVRDIFRRCLEPERDGAFGELIQRWPARRSSIRTVLDGADQRVPDGGFGDAGMQRVDTHAVLGGCAFQRDRFREQPHAALGRAVARHVRRRLDSRNRGNVDDASAPACPHQRERMLYAEEDAIEIDGDRKSTRLNSSHR